MSINFSNTLRQKYNVVLIDRINSLHFYYTNAFIQDKIHVEIRQLLTLLAIKYETILMKGTRNIQF